MSIQIQNVAFDLDEVKSAVSAEIEGLSVGEVIGEGGQRLVLEGTINGQPCAIKVSLESESARTEREIAIGQGFDHPSLPRIHSAEMAEFTLGSHRLIAFVEDRIDGETLIDLATPLQPCEVLEMIQQLSLAIDYLSAQSVVHRDISPKNIMRRHDALQPRWVLLDVGVARHQTQPALTSSSMLGPGTAPYAAPEQFDLKRARGVDGRTDIYALGVVGYEALAGHKPYDESTLQAEQDWHLGASAPLPLGRDDALEDLLREMLASRQHDRPRPDEVETIVEAAKEALGCS